MSTFCGPCAWMGSKKQKQKIFYRGYPFFNLHYFAESIFHYFLSVDLYMYIIQFWSTCMLLMSFYRLQAAIDLIPLSARTFRTFIEVFCSDFHSSTVSVCYFIIFSEQQSTTTEVNISSVVEHPNQCQMLIFIQNTF